MYFVLSTHLEGNTRDDKDQTAYNADVALLEAAFAAVEARGATLDVGCGTNFAVADQRWGKHVLAEAIARGHQASTHADIAPVKTTQAAVVTELRRQKSALDARPRSRPPRACTPCSSPMRATSSPTRTARSWWTPARSAR